MFPRILLVMSNGSKEQSAARVRRLSHLKTDVGEVGALVRVGHGARRF